MAIYKNNLKNKNLNLEMNQGLIDSFVCCFLRIQ